MKTQFDLTITTGDAIRLALLMSHYRSPCEIGAKKVDEARKVLRRLALACEPTFDGPPAELIETLANDLNTPGCIALMHKYRAQRQGRKLFASLRFLGFFGETCLPDEIKTMPPGYQWQVATVGPDAVAEC
jgi:cysteinyl-tRNA synthetase